MSLLTTHSFLPNVSGSARSYYPPPCTSGSGYNTYDATCISYCKIIKHTGSSDSNSNSNKTTQKLNGDYFQQVSNSVKSTGVNNIISLQVTPPITSQTTTSIQILKLTNQLQALLLPPLIKLLTPYLKIRATGDEVDLNDEGGCGAGYYWSVQLNVTLATLLPYNSSTSSGAKVSGDRLISSTPDVGMPTEEGASNLPYSLYSLLSTVIHTCFLTTIIPSTTIPHIPKQQNQLDRSIIEVSSKKDNFPLLSFVGDMTRAEPVLSSFVNTFYSNNGGNDGEGVCKLLPFIIAIEGSGGKNIVLCVAYDKDQSSGSDLIVHGMSVNTSPSNNLQLTGGGGGGLGDVLVKIKRFCKSSSSSSSDDDRSRLNRFITDIDDNVYDFVHSFSSSSGCEKGVKRKNKNEDNSGGGGRVSKHRGGELPFMGGSGNGRVNMFWGESGGGGIVFE